MNLGLLGDWVYDRLGLFLNLSRRLLLSLLWLVIGLADRLLGDFIFALELLCGGLKGRDCGIDLRMLLSVIGCRLLGVGGIRGGG